jgi:dihydrofolate reductase
VRLSPARGDILGKLIYSAIASLDGFVSDVHGTFGWARPDEEVHAFVNELERPVGTYLYGRRMYETMVYWEDPPDFAGQSPAVRDYAQIWHAADKIVFSKTLTSVASAKTRLEPDFDPDEVRELKGAAKNDLSVGGSELATQAVRAGLVDEVALFLVPVLVGAGHRWLGELDANVELELLDERRFRTGVVYVRYRARS